MTNDIDFLSELAKQASGLTPVSVLPLPPAGGDRRYFRFSFDNGLSLIGVVADNLKDAAAFVALSKIFAEYGIPVPSIRAVCHDGRFYIEDDLGDVSLFSKLSEPNSVSVIEDVMRNLARMQSVPEDRWVDIVAYSPFSRRQVMWDLNYFKYEFVKPCVGDFDEEALEDDFDAFADDLLDIDNSFMGFMMRDCQSRNVMLNGIPVFIDYQGGRKGPCVYDAVSFLWQAKAGFDAEFRRRMLTVYAEEFAKLKGVSVSDILALAPRFALFRTLQVLGAYGFRGLVQKRAHFVESIPGALVNLRDFISDGSLDMYPELKKISIALCDDKKFVVEHSDDNSLHIKVFSFSYKKGYPEDYSGNGGGFMFDCRGMHNPGRYEEYKPLTGRDLPVIEFLKQRGEVDEFVAKAVELVSPTVECYIRRGFSSLQIGFGCTGGRHRSVYCAEHLAHELAQRYPQTIVELTHREQSIYEVLK